MKKIVMKKLTAVLLAAALAALAGCGGHTMTSVNLMAEYTPRPVEQTDLRPETAAAVTDFSRRLFARSAKAEGNTLLSPLSVTYALAMTANGARGNTLAQLENLLGADIGRLNSFLHSYRRQREAGQETTLDIANGIWLRNTGELEVNTDFLQTNADYYNAGIYSAPFDLSTVNDINNFANQATDGIIKEIISEIPPERVMFLINAITFDGKWQEEYKPSRINDWIFTDYTGAQQPVQMMFSEENIFLANEKVTGFARYYRGGDYAFVALLPVEGVDILDYAKSLTGRELTSLMSNARHCMVEAGIPEFTAGYSAELNEILKDMGAELAFDENRADLTGMGTADRNLYIGTVLHKTFIEVNRKGTKAAAITLVGADTRSAEIMSPPQVILDRPFIYLIVDTENNIPVFIGTTMTMEN